MSPGRVSLVCVQCQKQFTVIRARKRSARFCCRTCKDGWQTVHVNQAWLKAGQAKAKARWVSMTPQERVAASNIEALKAAANSTEGRRKLSETKRGERNPMKRADVAEKVSLTIRERHGKMFSEQMKRTWADGRISGPWARGPTSTQPNKTEMELAAILAQELPLFLFLGNGAFWVGPCPSGKRRNPDFADPARKMAILMHGEYWHSETSNATEVADYRACGWQVLVVWSKELATRKRPALLEKLRSFGVPSSPNDLSGSRPSST